MPESRRFSRHRWIAVVASIVVVSLVVVLAVLWGRTLIEPDSPSTPAPVPTTPSEGGYRS